MNKLSEELYARAYLRVHRSKIESIGSRLESENTFFARSKNVKIGQ